MVQKRFNFPPETVELYAEKVANRGLCAVAQAESLRYKLLGGLAVRRWVHKGTGGLLGRVCGGGYSCGTRLNSGAVAAARSIAVTVVAPSRRCHACRCVDADGGAGSSACGAMQGATLRAEQPYAAAATAMSPLMAVVAGGGGGRRCCSATPAAACRRSAPDAAPLSACGLQKTWHSESI